MIWRYHIHKVVLRLPDSWWNWNLEMLVFEERGKAEYPQKNLSEQTQLTLWHRRRDLNPGHIGGRRALSPLRHPLLRVQTDANLLANKFLSEQLPTFLLFCDRRSVAQQCWIRLQTSSNINCWGHARRLHMVFKVLWVVSFPQCTAGTNIVGSCYIRVHSTGNTEVKNSKHCWLRPFVHSFS